MSYLHRARQCAAGRCERLTHAFSGYVMVADAERVNVPGAVDHGIERFRHRPLTSGILEDLARLAPTPAVVVRYAHKDGLGRVIGLQSAQRPSLRPDDEDGSIGKPRRNCNHALELDLGRRFGSAQRRCGGEQC